jgi:hypothetical protein
MGNIIIERKYEVETCECGHETPIAFNHYDENGIATCPDCVIQELQCQLKNAKEKIKWSQKIYPTFNTH